MPVMCLKVFKTGKNIYKILGYTFRYVSETTEKQQIHRMTDAFLKAFTNLIPFSKPFLLHFLTFSTFSLRFAGCSMMLFYRHSNWESNSDLGKKNRYVIFWAIIHYKKTLSSAVSKKTN